MQQEDCKAEASLGCRTRTCLRRLFLQEQMVHSIVCPFTEDLARRKGPTPAHFTEKIHISQGDVNRPPNSLGWLNGHLHRHKFRAEITQQEMTMEYRVVAGQKYLMFVHSLPMWHRLVLSSKSSCLFLHWEHRCRPRLGRPELTHSPLAIWKVVSL